MRRSMIKWGMTGAAVLALLAGCSESTDSASSGGETMDVAAEAAADAEMVATGESGEAAPPELGGVAVSVPKLAYVYDFTYRLAGEEIGPLQRRHADLCEQQGPASCRILGMSKSGDDGEAVTGQLQMAVATRHARAFGALLEDVAEEAGAEQLSADIASEELSKQIVDTEAHLAARTQLRDRLMDVLRTRKGKVSELVEAERSVAQVNEEIDQARSWLREMQGRVAYSTVTVRYETGAMVASDFLGPVTGALGSLGSIFGFLVAALIVLGAIALPISAVVWAARAINRRFRAVPSSAS
ncbi:MAG: DUF4349 domain-containing protein [Sphingomonadaceae bacterium]|nr:DUF4349 domain-containing protein [Sphingomonadaceae bacterium]